MTTNPPDTPPTGGPTKDEILAIALHKLELHSEDVFADIGCGTGKITLTAAPLVAKVHAVDIREEAFRWTEQAVKRSNISNVLMYHENAVILLSSLQKLDVAFVGGSRDLGDVISQLARLCVRRVVISVVLLETLNTAIKKLQEHDMFREVIHVQVSKSVPLAGGFMLKPLDPIYLILGGRKP